MKVELNPEKCPHCGCEKFYFIKNYDKHRCSHCRKDFTWRTGTKFENCKIPIRSIELMTQNINRPIEQLAQIGGITYKAAFRFKHLIIGSKPKKIVKAINPIQKTGQYSRKKLIEKRRQELIEAVLESEGKKSLQEIASKIAPEFRLEGCSLMLATSRRWKFWAGKIQDLEIPKIIVRNPSKIIPAYERKEIANERETEIPLLNNLRFFRSLDAPTLDGKENRHEIISNSQMTPLEILLLKEEIESEEWQERQRRIGEWNRWNERRNSAFYKTL